MAAPDARPVQRDGGLSRAVDAVGGAAEVVDDRVGHVAATLKPRLRGWIHAGVSPLVLAAGIVLVVLSPTAPVRWANVVFALSAVLLFGTQRKEISGGERATTNNRMELMAAIEALALLKVPCAVELYSDSSYLINAFNHQWIENWKRNGWHTSKKEPVENRDLWELMLELTQVHEVRFVKVKGHAYNIENNRCDELARGAITAMRG